MSTLDRLKARTSPALFEGQLLDQSTFHRLYKSMPAETRAELIGGVVSMAFPAFHEHSGGDSILGGWLFHYRWRTPGLKTASNGSTILGDDAEVQPDQQLRIPENLGGQTRIVGGYIAGAPELVIEVADSSRHRDLGPKKLAYEKAGVLEYLFVGVDRDEVLWFALRDGRFVELPPGDDGLFRSEIFPGLWLDPKALFAEDVDALMAALERGLATPEHAAFVAELAGRAAGR